MKYPTVVYVESGESAFRYQIEFEKNEDKILVFAYNDLSKYDVRRKGYQLFLETDDDVELTDEDASKILMALYREKHDAFNVIAPNLLDISYGEKGPENFDVLKFAFESVGNGSVLYSKYDENLITNLDVPYVGGLMMVDDVEMKIDPLQEVIKYTKIEKRYKIPDYNVISTANGNFLTKNILRHVDHEPVVYIINREFLNVSPYVGYFLCSNRMIIYIVSGNCVLKNGIDEEMRADSLVYTKCNDYLFTRAMRSLNVLSRINKNIDNSSIFVEDIESDLLLFSGKFPCGLVHNVFEERYVGAIREFED